MHPLHPLQDDLERVLLASGFDPSQRTVCLWEGVTMYLNDDAIDATLASLRRLLSPGPSLLAAEDLCILPALHLFYCTHPDVTCPYFMSFL